MVHLTSGADLINGVRMALARAADPARAPAMQAYMKSALPYRGVPLPVLRKLVAPLIVAHPLGSATEFDDTVEQLFAEAGYREERYAAVQLAQHRAYRDYRTPDRIPLYRSLIVLGAWWDTVDEVAANLVGPVLREYPDQVRPVVVGWIRDENIWLRRTSVIAQLTAKQDTDLALLTEAVDANAADRDFFIRKAIGWALRQYARTDPGWVRAFVDAREDTLSGLSKREARKHL